MLRIIPTAAHTVEDAEYTIRAFREIKKKLDNNAYPDKMAEFPK
jgi:glycine C-acetyltransferase